MLLICYQNQLQAGFYNQKYEMKIKYTHARD